MAIPEFRGTSGSTTDRTPRRILDATIELLRRGGIPAVSMRAVAAEADVALGLINYHFEDKTGLIAGTLRLLAEQDAALVATVEGVPADEQLRRALRHVADEEFLRSDYLALRLHLWSLAPLEPLFEEINRAAQIRYRDGLGRLIAAARPDLWPADVARRAADILVIQNGMWLTSILVVDDAAIERSLARCEDIAFGE